MNKIRIAAASFVALALLGGVSNVMAADPRNGAKLYNMHCSNCHGSNGRGGMPGTPDFSRGEKLMTPDPMLVKVLEQGRGVMPAYRGLLSTQEMLDVIAHLRTFQ